MGGVIPKTKTLHDENANPEPLTNLGNVVKDIYGEQFDLTRLAGKVVKITNVACK